MENLVNVESVELIEFSRAWSKLGSAVTDQVCDALDDPNSEVNPNALETAWRELNRFGNQEINDGLRTALIVHGRRVD